MHDAGAVRLVESPGDFRAVAKSLFQRQRAFDEALSQRFAFAILHDEEISITLPADIEEGADVRMVERGDRLRLALETLPLIRGRRGSGLKDLERHGAVQAGIARLVDFPHSPGAELFNNRIVRNGLTKIGHGSLRCGDTPTATTSTGIAPL